MDSESDKPAEGTNEPDDGPGGPDEPGNSSKPFLETFIASSTRQAILLFLLFFAIVVSISLFWGQISKALDYISPSAPKQALEDWRFHVIVAGLLLTWRIYCFFLNGLTRRETGLFEKLSANPVLWSFIAVLFISALALLLSFFYDLYSIKPNNPAIATLKILERVPTDWRFYIIILALAGLWASWCLYLKLQLREMLDLTSEDSRRQGLNNRDWQAYCELRGRALSLRTRAGLTLGGVFVLLLGGIYLILFILPQIKQSDIILRQQTKQQVRFQEKFGNKMRAIGEGRFWFKTFDAHPGNIRSRIIIAFSGLGVYSEYPQFEPTIRTTAASAKTGLIAREEGPIVVTYDGGETWKPVNLKLEAEEQIKKITRIEVGKSVLAMGNKGSGFRLSVTQSGELSLKSTKLTLKEGEGIRNTFFSKDGKHILAVGYKGSAFRLSLTQSGELSSKSTKLTLKEGEWIRNTFFSKDGKHILAVGYKGSAFRLSLTQSGELSSKSTKLTLKEGEWIRNTFFSKDGKHILAVGDKGSIFWLSVTQSGELSLTSTSIKLKEGEWIRATKFSANNKRVMVEGSKGSKFSLSMGASGKLFLKAANFTLDAEEPFEQTAPIIDNKRHLLVNSQGLVSVKLDDEQSWKETVWDGKDVPKLIYLVRVPLGDDVHAAVAIDKKGNSYYLKAHAHIKKWKTWPLQNMEEELNKNKLVRDSNLFQDIRTHLAQTDSIVSKKIEDNNESPPKKNSWFDIDNLTAMRIATMTVLFFLVQLLVRLYQYSMRLADFWDSRADAILLDENFAAGKALRFDDLVQALAPDAYDFKPMPKSLFGWSLPRRN